MFWIECRLNFESLNLCILPIYISYTNDVLDLWGKAVKMLKNYIMIPAHQIPDFNNFGQTCSLFIYTFFMIELGLVMSGKSLSSNFQPNNPLDMYK